jgi:hypothetical protein
VAFAIRENVYFCDLSCYSYYDSGSEVSKMSLASPNWSIFN